MSFDKGKTRFQAALIVMCALFMQSYFAAAEAKKPNIVLILMDNFGYGEIGVYGGEYYVEPQHPISTVSLPKEFN